MNDLNKKAWTGVAQFAIGMGLLLFVPAWTLDYWQAWAFLVVIITGSILVTVYLMKHDTKLLERRLSTGPTVEPEKTQKIVMSFAMLGFMALVVVPAFDHRFNWSHTPVWGSIAGNLFVVIGYYVIFLVFKENTFTAATVEIYKDQKVISTGPYSWVRHPMYFGGLLFLLGVPLALGSYWGLLVFVPLVAVIVWRLVDEEKLLAKDLPGYTAYQSKVKHRLVPFIW
jgi:protein-S-isoprenylcysteine O-methyltransferase Ste14